MELFYALLKIAHVLAVVVWVGGMAFAHFFLRPSLATLEAPQRLRLMQDVLGRFFTAVNAAVAVVLASGVAMIDQVARQVAATGGRLRLPASWIAMIAIGSLMMLIYGVIRLHFYKRMQSGLAARDPSAAAAALAQIRTGVTVNLALGMLVIAIAVGS